MTVLLEAHDIVKRFGAITALDQVSLDVDAGECVGLIGPNGAGKTTLFDCLSGKLRPDRGDVRFDGRSLLGMPVHRRARLGLARTFQRIELFSGMTVAEHLLVAERARRGRGGVFSDALARGRFSSAETESCLAVLQLLGLRNDADRPVEALSLGRARLVELGRALVGQPKLLFLDEPSSGLDRSETSDMCTVLQDVQAQSDTAILLVEHDVPMVQRLASRLYVLDAGRLIASGRTSEVLDDAAVRRAYLGVGV